MQNPSLGACLGYGWEHFKKYPAFHIVGIFLVSLISCLTLTLLYGPMLSGYLMGIRKADEGQKPQIGDVFSGFSKNFGASFLAELLCFLGFVVISLTVIGSLVSLVFLPFLVLVLYQIAIKDETNATAALKKAFAVVSGNLGAWILPAIVLQLISGLGSLLCVVGIYITLPVAIAGLYKLSDGLSNTDGAPAPAPTPPPAPEPQVSA